MTTASLTRRQQEVCDLAIQGITHKEIARRLKISPRTVEDHMYNVFSMYGVKNKVGLLYKLMEAKVNA